MAANTAAHKTTATHTQTKPKLVIAPAWARLPTTMLQAAYIPTGKTVDQRRTS
jgi:hypothetical protein